MHAYIFVLLLYVIKNIPHEMKIINYRSSRNGACLIYINYRADHHLQTRSQYLRYHLIVGAQDGDQAPGFNIICSGVVLSNKVI